MVDHLHLILPVALIDRPGRLLLASDSRLAKGDFSAVIGCPLHARLAPPPCSLPDAPHIFQLLRLATTRTSHQQRVIVLLSLFHWPSVSLPYVSRLTAVGFRTPLTHSLLFMSPLPHLYHADQMKMQGGEPPNIIILLSVVTADLVKACSVFPMQHPV